jgi:retron-type reverse transcriptase
LLGHILRKNDRLNWAGKGVPQGAPISCSLATLALRKLENSIDCVLYADDGLYFPVSWENYLGPLNDEEMGTEVKDGKTRILKVDGK